MAKLGSAIALPTGAVPSNPGSGYKLLFPDGDYTWADKTSAGVVRRLAHADGVYNAADYGAVGDGVADDTAEIQSALDAAYNDGGGVVVIPPGGSYKLSTFLVARTGTTIVAYGAYLKATGNTGLLRSFLGTDSFGGYNGHTRIRVFGGIWDANAGAGAGQTTATTNCMGFIHGRDAIIRDVTIRNVSSAHAIEFNGWDGGQVLNCRFEGFRDGSGDLSRQFTEAVQIDVPASAGSSSIPLYDNTPCKNILVQGCYMGPAVDGTGYGPFGKLTGSHTAPAGVVYRNIRILGNVCDGALDIGIGAYSWSRSMIANNVVIDATGNGISWDTANDALDNVVITGNVVVNPDVAGIAVNGVSGALTTNARITGNTVIGAGASSISCQYCDQPGVVGNSVRTGSSTGVFFQNGTGGQMVGNTVVSSGSNCYNVTSQNEVLISENVGRSPQANYIVNIQSATDCLIVGNHFSDPVTNMAVFNFTTSTERNFAVGNMLRKSGNAYVVRSNSTNGLVNYLINNSCKGFSDSAIYYGTSGQSNGLEWNTGSAGTPKGTIQKTYPSTTNAGTNLIG